MKLALTITIFFFLKKKLHFYTCVYFDNGRSVRVFVTKNLEFLVQEQDVICLGLKGHKIAWSCKNDSSKRFRNEYLKIDKVQQRLMTKMSARTLCLYNAAAHF